MKHLKFKKGDFITQSTTGGGSFAIFEGDVYEPTEKGGPNEYSLMCFYNPEHYTQDSNGNFNKEYVFECDIDDETCEYILDDNDMSFWRACTEQEKIEALKFLAEKKRIAFDDKTFTFRRLTGSERLQFGEPNTSTPHRGSESSSINPFYRGVHGPGSVGNPIVNSKKIITRVVDEDWEQKEPISNMNEEHIELVMTQCEKLKFAFDSYNVSTNMLRYPTGGNQVPVRQCAQYDMCGWPIESVAAMFGNYCGWGEYD